MSLRLAFSSRALQWGHRLSAMEGLLTLRELSPTEWLQWGHRLSAMEGAPEAERFGGGWTASMGPSPFSDGRYETLGGDVTSTWKLQWGHRLSAMEGFQA